MRTQGALLCAACPAAQRQRPDPASTAPLIPPPTPAPGWPPRPPGNKATLQRHLALNCTALHCCCCCCPCYCCSGLRPPKPGHSPAPCAAAAEPGGTGTSGCSCRQPAPTGAPRPPDCPTQCSGLPWTAPHHTSCWQPEAGLQQTKRMRTQPPCRQRRALNPCWQGPTHAASRDLPARAAPSADQFPNPAGMRVCHGGMMEARWPCLCGQPGAAGQGAGVGISCRQARPLNATQRPPPCGATAAAATVAGNPAAAGGAAAGAAPPLALGPAAAVRRRARCGTPARPPHLS